MKYFTKVFKCTVKTGLAPNISLLSALLLKEQLIQSDAFLIKEPETDHYHHSPDYHEITLWQTNLTNYTFTSYPMEILIFFIAHWYLSLLMQTFFLHRYAAHKMFTMSLAWEKFFYVLTWIFQGSSFLSPYAYGVMHRLHHAYADTEKDPHSPSFSSSLMDMMWKTKDYYNKIVKGNDSIEPKFKKGVPHWAFLEKLGDSWASRIGWGALYVLFYVHFATAWWMFLLLPVHFLMGPVHGVIINWYAHRYGYVNFKVDDTAKNLLPFDFLMMGESYHNNHHKYGGRANFGFKWHEFDPTYPFIIMLNKLKIIKLKPNNDLNYM